MKLQERGKSSRSGCNSTNESEMWLRTKADEEGFFLLKNLACSKSFVKSESGETNLLSPSRSFGGVFALKCSEQMVDLHGMKSGFSIWYSAFVCNSEMAMWSLFSIKIMPLS